MVEPYGKQVDSGRPRSVLLLSGLRHSTCGSQPWFVVCVDGLVKVIFTGDMWGGKELAMLCMILLILGLPLTGTVIVFETGTTAFGTSFRTTGEELEEFVRRRFLGFSSSSEQLTPERRRQYCYIYINLILHLIL